MSFLPNLYNITKQPFGKENQVTFAQTLLSSTCKYPFESRALMERNLQKCVLK